MTQTMNEWKRIPRKLRAALVQMAGTGNPTMSTDTQHELERRGWLIEGNRRMYEVGYERQLITTDDYYIGSVLSYEGRKVWNSRPTGNGYKQS